jgi:formyltetrahydrofolate deformylase
MQLITTLQCQDQPGIVNAMTSAILECSGNIIENQQFTDPITNLFVMRTKFDTDKTIKIAEEKLSINLKKFSPKISVRESSNKKKALVLVSKESHCLRDLFYLMQLGELPIEIPLVISNHDVLKDLVESNGVKFLKIEDKDESVISKSIAEYGIDFVVLARYMQVLSESLCEKMSGQIINIHHSFLPGFKGAKPYHQAYEKGVKIIGATAHFVTKDLDEGPIIEQDITGVSHATTPDELISIGRDIERRVLSKAVKLFAEDRIFQAKNRTIIFN